MKHADCFASGGKHGTLPVLQNKKCLAHVHICLNCLIVEAVRT